MGLRERTYITSRADADTALPVSVRSQISTVRESPRYDVACDDNFSHREANSRQASADAKMVSAGLAAAKELPPPAMPPIAENVPMVGVSGQLLMQEETTNDTADATVGTGGAVSPAP